MSSQVRRRPGLLYLQPGSVERNRNVIPSCCASSTSHIPRTTSHRAKEQSHCPIGPQLWWSGAFTAVSLRAAPRLLWILNAGRIFWPARPRQQWRGKVAYTPACLVLNEYNGTAEQRPTTGQRRCSTPSLVFKRPITLLAEGLRWQTDRPLDVDGKIATCTTCQGVS